MKVSKEEILNFVKKMPHTSFSEFINEFGERIEGDFTYKNKEYENLIYWSGLSKEFFENLDKLLKEGKIEGTMHFRSMGILIYSTGGMTLNLPIANRFYNYKRPHWVPITFFAPGSVSKRGGKIS